MEEKKGKTPSASTNTTQPPVVSTTPQTDEATIYGKTGTRVPEWDEKNETTTPSTPANTGIVFPASKEFEEEFINKNKMPTEAEIKAAQKKAKRRKIFAALSDGLTSISNLIFTSLGAPNMYNGESSLSKGAKVRYDKMMQDFEDRKAAYAKGLAEAKKQDYRRNKDTYDRMVRQRDFDRQGQWHQEEVDYRRKRDEVSDNQFNTTNERLTNEATNTHNRAIKKLENDKEVELAKIAGKVQKDAAGGNNKYVRFANENGSEQFDIDERAWEGAMPLIYEILKEDSEANKYDAPEDVLLNTLEKKDLYVKQNWYKSPRARRYMIEILSDGGNKGASGGSKGSPTAPGKKKSPTK